MKIYPSGKLCILMWCVILFPLLVHGAPVPHELGGIKLGADITDYPHLEYSNFLKEVVVTDWGGFAKGIISYGVCENPGMIIKTKFKFSDTSNFFYTTILDAYKKKFGEPGVWAGDAFGIQHIWKWAFVDKDNTRIEMVLQHNLKDPKLPIGTIVTLSYPGLIEKERKCFDTTHAKNSSMMDHSDCGPNCPMNKRMDSKGFMMPR